MRHLVSIIVSLVAPLLCLSQSRERLDIYFAPSSYVIDLSEGDNSESIERLYQLITQIHGDSLLKMLKVEIDSRTSPDGGRIYNQRLSDRRAASLQRYLCGDLGVADSLVTICSEGIAWDKLRDMVVRSSMPYRQEVIDVVDTTPIEQWSRVDSSDRWLTMVDSRNRQLMMLKGGEPYRYMSRNIFPKLRSATMTTIYYEFLPEVVDNLPIANCRWPQTYCPLEPEYEVEVWEVKPLLAIKSNLLFDLFTLINVEIEVPIGDRWSIAGEWIFPWWRWDNHKEDSKRNRIQMLNGNIEGRYWWGERADREILTGWFTGIYGGGGLYDFERKARGYQGEFFIAAGISGGYGHTINRAKSLRMEYSIGVGYLETNYRYYEANCYYDGRWHPVEQRRGRYRWIGPTRAKVSLSWLINYRRRRW